MSQAPAPGGFFRWLRAEARSQDGDEEENAWRVSDLQEVLGYRDLDRQFAKVVNLAKTAASKARMLVLKHFVDGEQFDSPGELYVTKYAAMLIVFNADPNKEPVAIAQSYFALQCEFQLENYRPQGLAKSARGQDFEVGVSALYGGLSVRQILTKKGLRPKDSYLDFAGSEELAANLFRITQTAAALRRGTVGEDSVCKTHELIGAAIRRTILAAGNLPPEALPPVRVGE